MAPVDKSADGSDPADKTATELPNSATSNKSVGSMAAQGLDQSGKQGTPVLQDGSGIAELTMIPKLEPTQVLSEYYIIVKRVRPYVHRLLIIIFDKTIIRSDCDANQFPCQ
jgi:hypothetical protein